MRGVRRDVGAHVVAVGVTAGVGDGDRDVAVDTADLRRASASTTVTLGAAAAAFSAAAASANSSLLQDGRDIAAASDAGQERAIYAAFTNDERNLMKAVEQIVFPQEVTSPLDQWVSAHQAMADTFQGASQASTPEDYGTPILAQSQATYDAGNIMRSELGLPPIAPGNRT